jgi:hypothetical protein
MLHFRHTYDHGPNRMHTFFFVGKVLLNAEVLSAVIFVFWPMGVSLTHAVRACSVPPRSRPWTWTSAEASCDEKTYASEKNAPVSQLT